MNPNLSGDQFGSVGITRAHIRTATAITEPHPQQSEDHPLPLSSNTNTSGGTASAWTKPNRVLPYSTATRGSLFTPNA